MSNPYTILAGIRETDEWFTVLDLKDAFYCIKLAEESQDPFAFDWGSSQLMWTVLVQGHKNSPTLFSQALKRDLDYWVSPVDCCFLSYVDNLLLFTTTEE